MVLRPDVGGQRTFTEGGLPPQSNAHLRVDYSRSFAKDTETGSSIYGFSVVRFTQNKGFLTQEHMSPDINPVPFTTMLNKERQLLNR